MKICKKCREKKSLERFSRVRAGSDARRSTCKDCHAAAKRLRYQTDQQYREEVRRRVKRWQDANPERHAEIRRKVNENRVHDPIAARTRWLRRNYGITLTDYEQMVEKQDARCAICLEVKPLIVDHCHTTGTIRSLLCDSCNQGLGRFADDPARLRRAADYIDDHRACSNSTGDEVSSSQGGAGN